MSQLPPPPPPPPVAQVVVAPPGNIIDSDLYEIVTVNGQRYATQIPCVSHVIWTDGSHCTTASHSIISRSLASEDWQCSQPGVSLATDELQVMER